MCKALGLEPSIVTWGPMDKRSFGIYVTLISVRGTNDLRRGNGGNTAPRDASQTGAVLAPTDKPVLPIVNEPPDRRLRSELVEARESSSPPQEAVCKLPAVTLRRLVYAELIAR